MVASSTTEVFASEDTYFQEKNGETTEANKRTADINGKPEKSNEVKLDIVWRNVIAMSYVHLLAFYSLYLITCGTYKWQTWITSIILMLSSGLGITAGAHRLWCHKGYKVKLPLEIVLAFLQTLACQNSIHEWCRDHRVHHKYSETDADPHNAKRGFFFSHMGWLLVRKHPDVKTKGRNVDMSDLEANHVVMFQKKYYVPLAAFVGFIFPTLINYYLCGEDFIPSFSLTFFRYAVNLHGTWLVNSAAHMWGSKPYDNTINPSENIVVAMIALGEGFHNYHHVFPWDYKTSELGNYSMSFTTTFIDLCAFLGLAYDLKIVPKTIISQRIARTGDGSHSEQDSSSPWGWDDKDAPKESKKVTEILHRLDDKYD